MFLLHGGLPTNWGDDLKLALAGIGQSVAPLQGLWVLLHVKHVINGLLQLPAFVPEEAFRQYVDTVVSNKHQGFPSASNANVLQQQSVPSECTWHDHQVDAVSTAVLPRDATVRQFKDAECKLQFHLLGAIPGQGVFPDSLVVDAQGKSLDDTEQLSQHPGFSVGIKRKRSQPEEHLDCPCEEWDVSEQPCHEGKDISPTLPFTVVDHGLSALDGFRNRAFLEVACPRIQAFDDLAVSLCPAIGKEARIDLLQRQGEVWADDEIRAHLRQIVCQGPQEQNLVAWDPLVVTSIIMFGHFEVIDEMVAKLPNGATVITALIIEKHWYPIMWRLEGVQAWAFTCGHAWGFSVAINKLHQRVCHALSCQLSAVRFHSLAFRVETCCGAMSILYLHHLIWGSDLPVSLPQLQEKHRSLRHALIGFLSGSELYPRPWIWGLGEGTWFSSLQEILVEHGVKACDAEARAKLVVEKLGEKQVLAALKSQASWKELKWYASQCIPMFQIIRPSELNDVIEARAQSGKPIGNRSQKKHGKGQGKGKGKGKSSDRQVVDPKGLRVEEGLFQCGENLAVSQITMQQVGPQTSGIVVCTRDEALPFLKTGRITSTGGLALIIVDHVDVPPTTTLLAERVRFPALCLANSEPILVDGLMFQLGAQSVVRKVAPPKFELVSVATCVIKFMVFRDQVPVSWDVVSAHPLKFLFSKIPLLQKCNTVGCGAGCGHWHPEQVDDVEEPILEVWGRQFMLQSFKPMPASEAEVFGVHLRLPAKLELPLQGFSGLDGVYLEPKEIDGKRPSTSFQVFWQQKATHQDIVHLRQITANALGIARMAGKYGIRCQTCHAEGVHATIRPGGSYLPQGKKSLYLMGPVPFGTLKTSVSQILDLLSWAARPMHPVPTAAHIDGVMWKLQAVNPPPQAFVVTDHGELLITRIDEPEYRIAPSASLLGASHTVSLVTSGSSTDPLQLNDPWEQHRSGVSSVAAASISVSDPVEVLEKKVMDAVVAKIGINNMEVDQAEIHGAKVASLEQKVSELQASQSQLHAMVVEQGNRQQTQISALQTQGDRLEVTVHESTCQLESFQEQFQNQIQKQQGQLDALFQQQMDRIESLFQKKARTSWWGPVGGQPPFSNWVLSAGGIVGAWLFWLVAMVARCQFWGVQSLRFVFAGVACAVGAFYFGLWVVGKVVSRGWTLDLGGLTNLGIKSCKISSLSSKVSCRKGILFWCCWVMLCVRIGEASHPGPGEHTQTWSVGLCNPNGIQGKLDQLEMLPGQVWFMCETHLSKLGMVQFKKNLRLTKSRFRYFVGGAPCAFRSQEAVGTCSGVATIASVPARVLPHSITPELFSTGRIQVSGFCMNQHWIQAAVVYGYPDSAKHVERTHMTECLVSEAIDRVALGAVGLRMIVGDFNHSCKELQQLKRLGDLGFVEAQKFALFRWGVPIKSTCRREEPIDQVWLSPEMLSLLDHVEISDCDWSDHSSVICHFSSNFVSLSTFHWRMPDAFQWPELDDTSVNVDWVANPTAAYAAFWHGVETEAKTKVPSLSQKALGRGMTLESKITSFQVPPCKVARHGGFQPKFYGASLSYLRWVKQLRRIQALRRLMVSQSQNPMHHIRKVEVWSAIRNAPGFPCGFWHWWSLNFVEHRFSTQGFPVGLPSLCDIRSMAVLFQAQVEKVESFQKKSRISAAKARREDNFQLLFQDCADERPSKVDTMIQSCHANIETVHPEDCSVVLEKPAELIAGHPVVVAGQPKQVLMACHDQVWLDSVGNIAEGDCLVQEIVHSSDAEILQQFEQVWAARWIKLSHLEPGKWDRVLDFVKGRFKPVAWNFPTWSTEMFRQNVVRKKTRAAVGPDGVSKHDLQNLPDSKAESLVKLFQLLESGKCVWPDQLTTGFVSSLYKGRGNGGVDSFRPITVFPWSIVCGVLLEHVKQCTCWHPFCLTPSVVESPVVSRIQYGTN